MPKAVVYNPTSHGGLGIRHLPSKQGLQKILHAIKHLCAKTSLGNLITVSLQAYQIQAGLAKCVLVNMHPLPGHQIGGLQTYDQHYMKSKDKSGYIMCGRFPQVGSMIDTSWMTSSMPVTLQKNYKLSTIAACTSKSPLLPKSPTMLAPTCSLTYYPTATKVPP